MLAVPRHREGGRGGGANFFGSALLQPARSVCVSLSAYFIWYLRRNRWGPTACHWWRPLACEVSLKPTATPGDNWANSPALSSAAVSSAPIHRTQDLSLSLSLSLSYSKREDRQFSHFLRHLARKRSLFYIQPRGIYNPGARTGRA